MKKLFLIVFMLFFVSNTVYSANLPSSKMKMISRKRTPYYSQKDNKWTSINAKKAESKLDTNFDFYFLYNGRLIGYSNSDMKFYECFNDENLTVKELSVEELEKFYPGYKFINLSEFSKNTNAIKIKKHIGKLKLCLVNDSEFTFTNHKFSTGNSKIKTYDLNSFVDIEKDGMIHFSDSSENSKNLPWYVILVR